MEGENIFGVLVARNWYCVEGENSCYSRVRGENSFYFCVGEEIFFCDVVGENFILLCGGVGIDFVWEVILKGKFFFIYQIRDNAALASVVRMGKLYCF